MRLGSVSRANEGVSQQKSLAKQSWQIGFSYRGEQRTVGGVVSAHYEKREEGRKEAKDCRRRFVPSLKRLCDEVVFRRWSLALIHESVIAALARQRRRRLLLLVYGRSRNLDWLQLNCLSG